jgi:lipopolysaccharide transport system ATP-binding protein
MSDVVIKVENVGKQYHLGKVGTGTMANDLNRWWHIARGKEDPYLKIGSTNDRTIKSSLNDIVWAVKDVNFEVKQGEVLGIIGKNGAGKSTLLKILSRVTAPTIGDIKVKGRIASLLEVGTGFHPDLSGRENIFLNGAILGMTKQEIKSKFDEIVEFSGVERYIDTPVKRYSSGMYVRLAFAVAAHLESEILIVDEVLAVGDAEFQKKCMGKMKDVAGHGRTVLFVSHNITALSNLCSSALVLKNGSILLSKSNVSEAVDLYLNDNREKTRNEKLSERIDRTGKGLIKIMDLELVNASDMVISSAVSGQKIKFKIGYNCIQNIQSTNISVAISISRSDGYLVTLLNNEIASSVFHNINQEGFFFCEIEKLPLTSGLYFVNVMVKQDDDIQDWVQEAMSFSVENGDFYNTGKMIPDSHKSILFEQKWFVM